MEEREKRAYIETMVFMASMDGKLDECEKEFFKEIGEGLGISADDTEQICIERTTNYKSLDEILSVMESSEAKESLIHSLIELCYVDGEYSVAEKNGMKIICNILNLDESVLKSIEMEWQIKAGKQAVLKGFDAVKNGLLFAGKMGKAGGMAVASGVSHGLGIAGSKLSSALANAKKLREENKQLREELRKTTVSEAVKQNIILQLNSKVTSLMAELKAEKERNDQNEEIIRLLQAQLEDLEATIEVAEAAKTA